MQLNVESNPLLEAAKRGQMNVASVRAVRSWLAEQLNAHQYAKLGQGGHTQNQVPLRTVFVDLPVSAGASAEPGPGERRELFLSRFLTAKPLPFGITLSAEHSLSHDELEDELLHENQRDRKNRLTYAATLLIGGPGQGKSTLGQLACQLHRAALLLPFFGELTSSEKEMVSSLQSTNFGGRPLIQLPTRPFLPLQVALPDFASWLSREQSKNTSGTAPALLRFLSDLPSARSRGVTSDDLLVLSCQMPVLLVLDGFDEVGATLDRQRIVREARTLLQQLGRASGSGLLLASTRPQGYAGELAEIGVPLKEVHLSLLKRSEALEYAQKLVEAKISGVDQQKKSLARLHEAAQEPATERLLTTPLQVTILAALVQQLGRAPRERWNLFSRYFAYTYDREIERETYASRLLADHRGHIERIHARVALLLQVDAERDGGGAAKMPRAQLEAVIVSVLQEEEVAESEIAGLVKDIAAAAEQRLVFLVEPEPGCFGFEIRSLQEFMAAWALTSGKEQDVEARLHQVARASMFRNVALFMVSRLYGEGLALREAIAEKICPELDTDNADPAAVATQAGASFALEALEEGAVLSQPKRARALMERAVPLLRLPPDSAHLRLARINTADTLPVLMSALERILIDDDQGSIAGAALVLLEASNRGDAWALEVVDRFWDRLVRNQSWVEACNRLNVKIADSIFEKIESRPTEFNPGPFLFPRRTRQTTTYTNWIGWLIRVYGREERWRKRSTDPWSVLAVADQISDLPEPTEPYPSAWSGWIHSARFEVSPSATTLASALRAIASAPDDGLWQELRWKSSWPLTTCINAAADPHDLLKLAESLEAGELGDTRDWIRLQANWRDRIDLTKLLSTITDHRPWQLSALESAPPLLSLQQWVFVDFYRLVNAPPLKTYRLAKEKFMLYKESKLGARLAEICLSAVRRMSSVRSSPTEFEISSFVLRAPEYAALLHRKPPKLDDTGWKRVLDAGKRMSSLMHVDELSDVLVSLLNTNGHPVLLRYAVLLAEFSSRHRFHRSELEPSLLDRTRVFLSRVEFGDNVLQSADLVCLQAWAGLLSTEQITVALDRVSLAALLEPGVWQRLVHCIDNGEYNNTTATALLTALLTYVGDDLTKGLAIQKLRDLQQERKSHLDNPSVWTRLGLPLPAPGHVLGPANLPVIPLEPVWLSQIHLVNICGIPELQLTLAPPEIGCGQWTVLIGPNGAGKTTILRSLVLALRNAKDPAIWPKGAFSIDWRRVRFPGEAVEGAGEHATQILVKDARHREYLTMFKSPGNVVLQAPEYERPRLFPLFAYGCRRGSALGGTARQVNLSEDDGPEIATIFDEGADLIHAETWLLQLEGDAQKNARSNILLYAIIDALKAMLNVQNVEISERKVWITELGKPRLPFSSLSDGYLTSAGWFLDLLARWLTQAEAQGFEIAEGFMSRMTGLVLIDEIDLHLHPRWQIDIIDRTRRLLPKMSFIVTTHNPLTLVGAKASEVWKLTRKDGKVSKEEGGEAPMLLTGGQLYKQYFEIADIYPEEVGRLLKQYSFLSGYAFRSDAEQAELEELVRKLQKHGVDPGWPAVDRVVMPTV